MPPGPAACLPTNPQPVSVSVRVAQQPAIVTDHPGHYLAGDLDSAGACKSTGQKSAAGGQPAFAMARR